MPYSSFYPSPLNSSESSREEFEVSFWALRVLMTSSSSSHEAKPSSSKSISRVRMSELRYLLATAFFFCSWCSYLMASNFSLFRSYPITGFFLSCSSILATLSSILACLSTALSRTSLCLLSCWEISRTSSFYWSPTRLTSLDSSARESPLRVKICEEIC